jgi:hypothetical protein
MTLRSAALMSLAAALAFPGAAGAQQGAPARNGTKVEVPPPYEDRLIEGGTLKPDSTSEDAAAYDREGWPRYWRVDGVSSYYDQQGRITRENGLRLNASIDTPEYGAITFDATARARPGSFIATVQQRGLAFDGEWFANNALGVVTTLGIDLTRSQYRFYLPTTAALGGTTEWIHDGDLQLQASAGEPGLYDGLRLAGFQSLGGSLSTAGAQWAFAPRWQAGIQLTDAQNVQSAYSQSPNGRLNAKAAFASVSWNGPSTRLQGNVLASDADDSVASVRAVGVWLDGSTVSDRYTHHYGIYRLEPGLTWGYQPVNNDIEGAYYRLAYQSLRWQMDGGIDQVNSVSGRGSNGTYATLNGRYQVTTGIGLGGNGSYLHSGIQDAWTVSGFSDYAWSMGQSRLSFNAAGNHSALDSHAEQIGVDHTWNTPIGTRLSTSLAATRDVSQSVFAGATTEASLRSFGIGVLGGGDITDRLSIDANLQYNIQNRGGSATGVYGNVVMNWRYDSHWSLTATYYDNRDDSAKLFTLDPLIPVINPVPVQRNRAAYLTLRYEDRAGTPIAPLGGRPGSAAGAIAGYVFLDTNDNGRRDAGEPGAANVTVLLDRRFSARTDDAGRFEFPFVAAGAHTITVLPDNLPLPWAVEGDKREISVSARESALVEIAARRLR